MQHNPKRIYIVSIQTSIKLGWTYRSFDTNIDINLYTYTAYIYIYIYIHIIYIYIYLYIIYIYLYYIIYIYVYLYPKYLYSSFCSFGPPFTLACQSPGLICRGGVEKLPGTPSQQSQDNLADSEQKSFGRHKRGQFEDLRPLRWCQGMDFPILGEFLSWGKSKCSS